MLSIIIITLNEEKYLPKLLRSIKKQDFKDYEIIVSDGGSKDKTIKIARKFKCKVIKGGLPSVGRNNGAKAAKGDLLLFLDADVVLQDNSLKRGVEEFKKRKLDAATYYFRIKGHKLIDKIIFVVGDIFLFLLQYIDPHAPGSFILCKKNIFDKLNGFNEKLKQAEDHNLVKRASKIGKFRVLYKCLSFSMRRFEKEGRFNLLMKYAKSEFYRKIKGDIESDIFEYEYGKY